MTPHNAVESLLDIIYMTKHSSEPGNSPIADHYSDEFLVSGALPPLEVRLERLDHTKRQITQLMQRWDNRMIFERCSLGEEYVSGRLSIALYFESHVSPYYRTDGPQTGADSYSTKFVAVFNIVDIDVSNPNIADERDEQPMLVDCIHLGQGPDGLPVRSRPITSEVRFYGVDDDANKFGGSDLYVVIRAGSTATASAASFADGGVRFGITEGRYEFLPFFMHGKGNPVVSDPGTVDDFGSHVVESRSQGVDCVSDRQGDFCWQRIEGIDYNTVSSGIRIKLYSKSAEVTLIEGAEGFLHLTDMAIGPLNL